MALYFPINRLAHGGLQLALPLDQHTPLYPPSIVPYLLASLSFVIVPVWAALRVPRGDFEEYIAAILLATWTSYVVYIAFPTYVTRPEIVSKDIFSTVISALYRTDLAYNAMPSGHVFYSTLSFLYLERWRPRYKLVWLASWVIILASALLTRQHNILDLMAGIFLAGLAYLIAAYIRKKRGLKFAS
jgi:membrane-associated phospholipid phosphatase